MFRPIVLFENNTKNGKIEVHSSDIFFLYFEKEKHQN
jgi:hypothetical protein